MAKKETGVKPEGRIVYIKTIDEKGVEPAIIKLMEFDMADPKAAIRMIVNSFGGSAYSMFALYDAMKTCQAPVVTIGLGKAMSAGLLILAAGEKGERRLAKHTRIMAHEMWTLIWGKLYEVDNEVKEARNLQILMEQALAEETGQTEGEIHRIMQTHKDKYMSAEEAVELGFADKVI